MRSPTTPEPRVLPSAGLHAWQLIAFLAVAFLYLTCYFGRYNLSAATPGILAEFEFSKNEFGWIMTIFTMVYSAGQFVNGWLADRFGPKRLLVIGGFGCVAANACFGLSDSYATFAAFWAMNAYFSSMLWSPCCRILYNWFPTEPLGILERGVGGDGLCGRRHGDDDRRSRDPRLWLASRLLHSTRLSLGHDRGVPFRGPSVRPRTPATSRSGRKRPKRASPSRNSDWPTTSRR